MSCTHLQKHDPFMFNNGSNQDPKQGKSFTKVILAAILVFLSFMTFAQKPADHVLKVTVRPTVDGQAVEGVTVKLYRGTEELVIIDTTETRQEVFYLERNESYTIEVSAPGRLTRKVAVLTKVPSDLPKNLRYKCVMDIEMPSAMTVYNDYFLDFPVALIEYNEDKFKFEHIKDYTATVRSRLEDTDHIMIATSPVQESTEIPASQAIVKTKEE